MALKRRAVVLSSTLDGAVSGKGVSYTISGATARATHGIERVPQTGLLDNFGVVEVAQQLGREHGRLPPAATTRHLERASERLNQAARAETISDVPLFSSPQCPLSRSPVSAVRAELATSLCSS